MDHQPGFAFRRDTGAQHSCREEGKKNRSGALAGAAARGGSERRRFLSVEGKATPQVLYFSGCALRNRLKAAHGSRCGGGVP